MTEPVLVANDGADRKRLLRLVIVGAVLVLALLVAPKLLFSGGSDSGIDPLLSTPTTVATAPASTTPSDAPAPAATAPAASSAPTGRNPFTPTR